MKKIIALCITAALAVSMVACGASSENETSAPAGESTTQNTQTTTTAPATTEQEDTFNTTANP